MRTKLIMVCAALLVTLPAQAADAAKPLSASDPQQQVAVVDTVVAVVNDDVITRNELDAKLAQVVRQLQRQGTPLPEADVLEKQILERMITDLLQAQFARESGLRVDDVQLDQAIARIAQQNGFPSPSEFRAKLEAEGLDFKKFREDIRSEIISTRLREREVESKLVIGDGEVDSYLANKAKMGVGQELQLAHIFVVVPEQASADKIQAAREKANQALAQLKGGADFAQVAAGYSDAKDALNGGNLGWRPAERVPPMFLDALLELRPGQTTGVMRSASGFHILRLLGQRNAAAPVVITQTHARHILIKTSEIVSEGEAKKRLMAIKSRIEAGADFADEARRNSQDGSAQQGGDLDWLSPGQTVKEFEETMNRLEPGTIGIAHTQFGWHLIQVLERRNTDVSEKLQRDQARQAIGSFKSEELFQDWLRQLRDRAYIEYRLEGQN